MKSVLGATAGLAVGLMMGVLAGSHQRDQGFRDGIHRATSVIQREAVRNGHGRWRREEDDSIAFEWINVRPDYRGDEKVSAID